MRKTYRVRWDIQARQILKAIIEYIAIDSPEAAKNVRTALLKLTSSLSTNPEKYPKELLLEGHSENFRSLTKWHYKIIYEVTDEEVIIVYIFHTSQEPSKLKRKIR